MIEVVPYVNADFERFFLTGRNQPKSVFFGVEICSQTFETSIVDERLQYIAYAVTRRDSKIPILVLHRKELALWDNEDGVEAAVVYSKYLVPKSLMEIQRFDSPDTNERFGMRKEYERFLTELGKKIYGDPDYFYLTVDYILEAKENN